MVAIAEIERQRTDFKEALALVMEDRISAGHYLNNFCRFASKFFPNEGRFAVHESTGGTIERVLISFGHRNEEIKIEIEKDKIFMAIPSIGGILECKGKLITPPKELQSHDHLVLVTDKGYTPW